MKLETQLKPLFFFLNLLCLCNVWGVWQETDQVSCRKWKYYKHCIQVPTTDRHTRAHAHSPLREVVIDKKYCSRKQAISSNRYGAKKKDKHHLESTGCSNFHLGIMHTSQKSKEYTCIAPHLPVFRILFPKKGLLVFISPVGMIGHLTQNTLA